MTEQTNKAQFILDMRNSISMLSTELSLYGMTLSLYLVSFSLKLQDKEDADIREISDNLEKIVHELMTLTEAVEEFEKFLDEINMKLFKEEISGNEVL